MTFFRSPGILFLLSLGTTLPALVTQSASRPDAPDAVNPFLHTPAQSLKQLVQEVRQDGVIRRRYAQFFHVPERKVVPYLRENLQPTILRQTGNYTVFYVSEVGTFYPTLMELSSGTPVFVGRDGVPRLLRGAGNPVSPFSMVVTAQSAGDSAPAAPESVKEKIVPTGGADIPLPTSTPPLH